MDNTVFLAQEKQVLELVKGRHDKIFDSFMLMFARTSSVYIYLRFVFTPRPSPKAVLLVVVVPFVVFA